VVNLIWPKVVKGIGLSITDFLDLFENLQHLFKLDVYNKKNIINLVPAK